MKASQLIMVWGAGVALVAPARADGAYTQWVITTIETQGDTGYFPSLANLPSGEPAVAYQAGIWVEANLTYAQRSGCGWQRSIIEPGGFGASLIMNGSGQPAITHVSEDGPVRYCHEELMGWQSEDVDTNGGFFGHTSLKYLPSGEPAVSYSEGFSTGDIRFAKKDPFSGDWAIDVFPGLGSLITAGYTSLVILPSGQPAIATGDITSNGVVYCEYDGLQWQQTVVDSCEPGLNIYRGHGVDMVVLPSGWPAMSYYEQYGLDPDVSRLKYAWFDGVAWHKMVVDDPLAVPGDDAALAILPSGHPAIAYADGAGSLKFAWHDGSMWQTTVVDSGPPPGQWRFAFWCDLIVFASGIPAIAYYDNKAETGGDLKFAYASVLGDGDADLDVDLADYLCFHGCLTGPDGGPVSPGCEAFDFEGDDDVDLQDFAAFQIAFTGPG